MNKETSMLEFVYQLEIKESHLDTFGHVNNATYLNLYEEARWDFITKRGYGLKEIQELKTGPVILDLNLKFKKELKNREVITIKTKTLEASHRLIMKLQQTMHKPNGDIASVVEMSVGLMDLSQRKLIEPTKKWLYAIGHEE